MARSRACNRLAVPLLEQLSRQLKHEHAFEGTRAIGNAASEQSNDHAPCSLNIHYRDAVSSQRGLPTTLKL